MKTKKFTPFERQKRYLHYKEFIEDWGNVRLIMRELQSELVKVYKLVDVNQINNLLPVKKK